MAFHGSARKKLWNYGLSWQQHRASQNCACCLVWQWHGSIPSPGRTSSLPVNSHAWFAVSCFSAVGKVLSVIPRSVLGPLANHLCFPCWDWEIWCLLSLAEGCCCSLLNCFSHVLIFCLSTILCRGIPPPAFLSLWQTHQHLQTGQALLFLMLMLIT